MKDQSVNVTTLFHEDVKELNGVCGQSLLYDS